MVRALLNRESLVYGSLILSGLLLAFLISGEANLGPVLLLGIFGLAVLFVVLLDFSTGVYVLFLYSTFLFLIDRLLSLDIPLGVLSDSLIGIMFVAMIIQAKGRSSFQWKLNEPIAWMYFLFYFYFTLEIVNPSAVSMAGWLASSRSYLLLLLFYIFIHFFDSVKHLRNFIYLWLLLAFVIAAYGLFQAVFGLRAFELRWLYEVEGRINFYFIWGKMRTFSFLSDPSAFGLFMSFCSLSTMVLIFGPFSTGKKLVLAFLTLFMLVSMSYAGTRTAYAMFGIGVVFFVLLNLRNRKVIFASSLVILLFLVLMFGPFYSAPIMRMRTTFNVSGDASMGVRDVKRIRFQPYIQSHPMGGGVNTAGNNGLRYSKGHVLAGRFDPDSGYLRTAMEMGSIGLILLLSLNVVVLITGIRAFFSVKDATLRIVILAFTVPFFGLSVAHFTQDALFQKPINILVLATYAFLIKVKDLDRNSTEGIEYN